MDIFGKDIEDYETLTLLRESRGDDFLQSHMAQRARHLNVPQHNFDAFGSFAGQLIEAEEPNAQAIAFVYNNLTAIQQMADEILYQENRFQMMLHINETIPAGADTYAVRITDRVGKGRFIEARGSNAPSAGAVQRLQPYPLRYGGIVAEWNFKDIRSAMLGGFPLATETVQAAVDGAVNHIEEIAFVGDEETGYKGILNHADVPVSAATASFASRTGQELVDDLQGYIVKFISDTKEIIGRKLRKGFCIYLPTTQAGIVTTKRIADGNDLTVWEFVQRNNFWRTLTGMDIELHSLPELTDAAANGTDDRMVIGLGKEERVVELGLPLAPRIIHVLEQAYGMIAPLEYEVANGVSMKRPTALRYYDGI